jgi:tellurite resistance protein TehA-like permease
MIGLLIFLLVGAVVLWAARRLMAAWEVPEPIATTVWILLVVVFAVALLLRVVPGAVHM